MMKAKSPWPSRFQRLRGRTSRNALCSDSSAMDSAVLHILLLGNGKLVISLTDGSNIRQQQARCLHMLD